MLRTLVSIMKTTVDKVIGSSDGLRTFPLVSVVQCLATMPGEHPKSTYSSQCKNLSRAFAAQILWNTVEIEDELGESLPIMPLPLPYRIDGFRRWSFMSSPSKLGLSFFIPHSDQFLLKSTWLGIIRTTCEELGVCVLESSRSDTGW